MVVLHIEDAGCIRGNPLYDEPTITVKGHRILAGAVAAQGVQPQCPVSVELRELINGP